MAKESHFTEKEFACPCCGKVIISPILLSALESARDLFGQPIIIESGFRCEKHNAEVGGVPGSAHTTGEAADVRCFFAGDRFELLRIFFSLGLLRIGIDKKFLHVDVSKTLPQRVVWLYGDG